MDTEKTDLSSDEQRARRQVRITRFSTGKAQIEYMAVGAASDDIDRALRDAGGWKDLDKVATNLKKMGYNVKMYGKS